MPTTGNDEETPGAATALSECFGDAVLAAADAAALCGLFRLGTLSLSLSLCSL
jgi:hypothetical protein